jgi:hypothetical protein
MNGSVKASTEVVKSLGILPKNPALGWEIILKKDL